MVGMANSADILDELKKKNLDVVAVQRQDGDMIVWVANQYGEMSFIQINSK
jgi:hypothetical protein